MILLTLLLFLALFPGCTDDHNGVRCEAFINDLRDSGVILTRVEDIDHPIFSVGSRSYFSVLPTRADTEAGGRLTIWEYRKAEDLEKDSGGISKDGYGLSSPDFGIGTEYGFISRPHWFRTEWLIILYTGPEPPADDHATLAALRKIAGDEFAGG